MTDPFGCLGIPRRPWVDLDLLRKHYLQASRSAHPDAPGGSSQAFTTLQEAYETLRDPAKRLRHLAEQSTGSPSPLPLPEPADLFMKVAAAIQAADTVLRSPAPTTHLTKAVATAQAMTAHRQLESSLEDLGTLLQTCENHLLEIDARWPDVTKEDLLALASQFPFVHRWRLQAKEKMFQLGVKGSCRYICNQ